MKHGFVSSHQHGGGIDFNYPPGFTKARPGKLKQMFESMFPGSFLLPEEDHLHLQLPQPISSGAGALNQGRLLNDTWNSFMNNRNFNSNPNQATVINLDQSSSESGNMIVTAGATDQNTPGIKGSGSENLVQ